MNHLLTYEEYRDLAINPIDEKLFDKWIKKAVLKFNYFTNGRIAKFSVVPYEVKITLCDFVDLLNSYNANGVFGLTSYSNGIESFGYAIDESNPEKSLNSIMWGKIKENLSEYPMLIYRGIE